MKYLPLIAFGFSLTTFATEYEFEIDSNSKKLEKLASKKMKCVEAKEGKAVAYENQEKLFKILKKSELKDLAIQLIESDELKLIFDKDFSNNDLDISTGSRAEDARKNKGRKEIKKLVKNGDLSFDQLFSFQPYLDSTTLKDHSIFMLKASLGDRLNVDFIIDVSNKNDIKVEKLSWFPNGIGQLSNVKSCHIEEKNLFFVQINNSKSAELRVFSLENGELVTKVQNPHQGDLEFIVTDSGRDEVTLISYNGIKTTTSVSYMDCNGKYQGYGIGFERIVQFDTLDLNSFQTMDSEEKMVYTFKPTNKSRQDLLDNFNKHYSMSDPRSCSAQNAVYLDFLNQVDAAEKASKHQDLVKKLFY